MQQILYYYDGNFLRKEKINDYFFNIVFVDSVLWTCNLCMHIDKYMACALSLAGDTVTVVPNPNYGIESLNEERTRITRITSKPPITYISRHSPIPVFQRVYLCIVISNQPFKN